MTLSCQNLSKITSKIEVNIVSGLPVSFGKMSRYLNIQIFTILYLLPWCFVAVLVSGNDVVDDPGFDMFFQTNTEEMQDVPIYFEKPLPTWLRGSLIRNGLGRFGLGKHNFTHAFDAFGKLSSWKFPGNGSAYFTTKFLQSDFYTKSIASNDIVPYLMFESVTPPFNEFQKLEALARGIDNMNVNIVRFTNGNSGNFEYVTLNDFWKIYEVEPLSLSTKKSITAGIPHMKHLTRSAGFLSLLSSAHPLPEHATNNHVTFLSSVSLIPGIKSKITLVRIKSADDREAIAEWEVDKVPYMHSFSLTKKFAILFAAPFYINVPKMLRYAEPFDSLDWFENLPTAVYVVDLTNGHVKTLKTDNVFTMHHINAFENGNSDIVVDISSYPSPAFVKNLEMATLRDPVKRNQFDTHALLKRYHINVNTTKISVELFKAPKDIPFASNIDMTTINENYRYKQYCFVYGVVLKKDNIKLSHIALVKKDLCGKGEDAYWYISTHYPVEAWFVPTPGGDNEDDGILMTPVLDGDKKTSYLAMIDAKTMKLINKAYLPTAVPFNLHGRFFSDLF